MLETFNINPCGIYKINNGGEISQYKNVITDDGRIRILDIVAGKIKGFASAIIAGIGDTAALSTDKALEFMIGGSDINATITDPISNKIYFKATLPIQDDYEIHELGCFSTNYTGVQTNTEGSSLLLAVFGSQSKWVDVVGSSTLATTNNRVSTASIQYASFSSAKGNMTFIKDFSNLASNTTFDLAYYTSGVSVLKMRFMVDASNYYELTSWPVTNGYHISKKLKSAFVATGTPSWDAIKTLEFEASGTSATLSLDCLRYTNPVVSTVFQSNLLSRVVLPSPQRKLPGVSMDVEYVLELG